MSIEFESSREIGMLHSVATLDVLPPDTIQIVVDADKKIFIGSFMSKDKLDEDIKNKCEAGNYIGIVLTSGTYNFVGEEDKVFGTLGEAKAYINNLENTKRM